MKVQWVPKKLDHQTHGSNLVKLVQVAYCLSVWVKGHCYLIQGNKWINNDIQCTHLNALRKAFMDKKSLLSGTLDRNKEYHTEHSLDLDIVISWQKEAWELCVDLETNGTS